MKHALKFWKPLAVAAALALAGCAHQPVQEQDLTAFRAEHLRSILVVPAINKSVDVDAPDYFLSTIARPIAEHGYYVFPVNAVKQVMELDGMGDADQVFKADPTRLGDLFGADAILYVSINRWDARYLVLKTAVTVDFDYEIKSGHTGQSLWKEHAALTYTPQSQNTGNPLGNLIAAAVTAAMAKAKPNYIPLTQQANAGAMAHLPNGPYLPVDSTK